MDKRPFISIIVPVYNGGKFLDQCLDALTASFYQSYELIVVDDGSTDDSAEISRQKGARVLQTPRGQSGPAAARNYGAQKAQGGILFFVDADVVVQQKTVAQIAADFLKYPDIGAVFGSYDDSPAESNFLSLGPSQALFLRWTRELQERKTTFTLSPATFSIGRF